MKKYEIDKDFKKFYKVNPPLNKLILPFIRLIGKFNYTFDKKCKLINSKNIIIPVLNGKIKAKLYSPKTPTDNLVIFYHGGGFCYPAGKYHYNLAKKICLSANVKVLFVNYRLAPKYSFPTPIEDSFCAYNWALNNLKSKKIVLMGDSAGGNLCVGVINKAFEKNLKLPIAQMLLYPALCYDPNLPSMQTYTDVPMCSIKDLQKYQKLYLKNTSLKDILVSPIYSNPEIMPTTYIETAEFDCLKDGALLFAQKLQSANKSVTVVNTSGTIHAFDIVPKSKAVQKCTVSRLEFLNKVFK